MAGFNFQDPLISSFSKIQVAGLGTIGGRTLFLEMADVALKAKNRPKPSGLFSKQGDPVLEAIYDFLKRKRLHLTWDKVILLGCSAGGNVALRTLFKYVQVPHLPIVIAMHHNPGFSFSSLFQMANGVKQTVVEAKDGATIKGGTLYFLPGEMDISFKGRMKMFSIQRLRVKPKFRPEIDKVFVSAGAQFKDKAVGVIMSGMLYDGAAGVKAMSLNRSEIWVQEPSGALFKEMPKQALLAVPRAKQGDLMKIAERINTLSTQNLRIEPMGGFRRL